VDQNGDVVKFINFIKIYKLNHVPILLALLYVMILAANTPYFAPYPGFFEKAARADVFVLLDTVQFPQGTTWISRNRFKSASGSLWVTVPVWKKGRGLQRIEEVRICYEGGWETKLLQSLVHAYQHAPFFEEHYGVWEEAVKRRYERLLDLNRLLIAHLMDALGIVTRVVRLSDLGIEERGDALLVELCRSLGADTYLVQQAAASHLDSARFRDAGLELCFFRPASPVYPQLWGSFVGNLSTFDLLFNCGPKARNYIRKE
jgi:hypothetical protein